MSNRKFRRRAAAIARKQQRQHTPVVSRNQNLPAWRMALVGGVALGALTVSTDISTAQTAGADNVAINAGSAFTTEGANTDFLAGDDTITFGINVFLSSIGTSATVNGGADNDLITGGGPITLSNAAGSSAILGDSGNDTITLMSATIGGNGSGTVDGGVDNDSIKLTGSSRISNGINSSSQILGDAGADTIDLENAIVGNNGDATVDGGADNDSIRVYRGYIAQTGNSAVQIIGDSGNDTIDLYYTYVGNHGDATVDGGIGNDSIAISGGTNVAYGISSQAAILGDAGNDTIAFTNARVGDFGDVTVSGGAENDYLYFYGRNVAYNTTSSVQIMGDAGNDTIAFDYIVVGRDGDVTVNAGLGDDQIILRGEAGAGGADSTVASGASSQVSILGDAGNDSITISDTSVADLGVATISGGDNDDNIAIGAGTRIGDSGTVSILGDAGNDTIRIDGEDGLSNGVYLANNGGRATINGGADNDLIELMDTVFIASVGATSEAQILGDVGNDTITLSSVSTSFAGNTTVDGGAGTDQINITNTLVGFGGNTQIDGGTQNDTITLEGANFSLGTGAETVDGGSGDDSIVLRTSAQNQQTNLGATTQILGSAGNDTISIDRSVVIDANATIDGGADNDVLAVNFSVGSNAIDFSQFDNIETLSASGSSTIDINTLSNFSTVAVEDNSTVTITATGADKTFNLNGTLAGTAGNDSIRLGFQGNIGTNAGQTGQILGNGGNDTVVFNNTVIGDAGSANVQTTDGADQVTIYNFSRVADDAGSMATISTGDNNDTVRIENNATFGVSGSATLSTGAGDDEVRVSNNVSIAQNLGSTVLIQTEMGNDSLSFDGAQIGSIGNATVDAGDDNDTIQIVDTMNAANGSSIADSLLSESQVLGGRGMDSITITNTNVGDRGKATVDGGDDNDTIVLNGGTMARVILGAQDYGTGFVTGGSGQDSISTDGTIIGDVGSGTISGGADDDDIDIGTTTLLGNAATGSGLITGDAGNDTISLNGTQIGFQGSGTVDGGADNDVIDTGPNTNLLTLGVNGGSSGLVTGGDGNDTLNLANAVIGSFGSGSVSGGSDDDSIALTGNTMVGRFASGSGHVLGDAGNDSISVTGKYGAPQRVGGAGEATIDGGVGNDKLDFLYTDISADGGIQVLGDAGNDSVSINYSTIGGGGNANIDTGTGMDNIMIGSSSLGGGTDVRITGGADSDIIMIFDTSVGDSMTGGVLIAGEAGDDSVVIGGKTSFGVFGNASLDTGEGADFLHVTGDVSIGTMASVTTGAGNDTILIDLTVDVDDLATVDGGEGTDSLLVNSGGDETIDAAALQGFEEFGTTGGGTLTLAGSAAFQQGFSTTDNGKLNAAGDVFTSNIEVRNGGEITVSGSLRSNGTGNQQLLMAGPQPTGITIVENSTLTNNGTFNSQGGIFVEEDGVLAGNGTFNGHITGNSGIISPGNSIGVQTFNSGATFNNGTTIIIEVTDGAADQIVVVGSVEINGATLQLDDLAPAATDVSAQFVIIDNDGSDPITGAGFGTIVDNLAFLDPTVTINGGDGNDVLLTFQPIGVDLSTVASNWNQISTSTAFNSLPSSDPDVQTLITEFTPLTTDEAKAALNTLSGEVFGSANFATNTSGLFVSNSIGNVLNGFATADNATQSASSANNAVLALSLAPQETAERLFPADVSFEEEQTTGPKVAPYVFSRGLFRNVNVQADGNGGQTDVQNRGFVAGGGANFDDRFFVGAGAGYLRSDVDVNSVGSSVDSDGAIFNIHGRYQDNGLDVSGNVGYLHSDHDSSRNVIVGGFNQVARASFKSHTFFGNGEIGYTSVLAQGVAVRPFASAGFAITDRDAFTETGAGAANLVVASTTDSIGQFAIGTSVSRAYTIGNALIVPRLEAALDVLVGDVTPATTATFAAGGLALNTVGAEPGRVRGRVSAGAATKLTPKLTGFFDYQGIFSSNDIEHSVRSGLRYRF